MVLVRSSSGDTDRLSPPFNNLHFDIKEAPSSNLGTHKRQPSNLFPIYGNDSHHLAFRSIGVDGDGEEEENVRMEPRPPSKCD